MPKFLSSYVCQQCGFRSSQFLGRCPQCGEWNSLVETVEQTKSASGVKNHSSPGTIINLSEIEQIKYERLSTQIEEFDRVLGGGIVLGSIILISGEPGIGKSTLLTQLALNVNEQVSKLPVDTSDTSTSSGTSQILYIAGEESAQQIKIRVDRIKPRASFKVVNETDIDVILSTIEQEKPSLVIVDSIQTLETSDLESPPGSVGQVRETAHRLQHLAKNLHIPILLVGHITKEGSVAGPKTLEHLVDVVLSLEGEPNSSLRILRTSKNRFGATDEVGIFEMEETGMKQVVNPSAFFLEEQQSNSPGSVVVPTLNGLRPILVEVQALVTKTFLPVPRRVGAGIDNNRLQLLVAVLAKRLGLPLYDQEIFVNITGGLKVLEPAADLGIALAIVSSFKNHSIPQKTVLLGEVGLLGELRSVKNLDKRLSEAKKLGFTNFISPQNAKSLEGVIRLLKMDKQSQSKTIKFSNIGGVR